MKGKVLGYDHTTQAGVITCSDGNRYKFTRNDWKSPGEPALNTSVDFDVDGGNALEIYRIGGVTTSGFNTSSDKNRMTAGLLAIFLGGLGIHKFYLGKNTAGVIMLIVSLCGWVLFFIPNMVIWVISLIEGILYLTKTDEQFQEIYVDNGGKSWF